MNIPISEAVQVGDTIYIGGIPPLDDINNLIGKDNVAVQTSVVLDRIASLLASIHMTLDDLVFVTVYLVDLSYFSQMNAVYAETLSAPYPARKVIQTPLTVEGALIEMTAVARRGASAKTVLKFSHALEGV